MRNISIVGICLVALLLSIACDSVQINKRRGTGQLGVVIEKQESEAPLIIPPGITVIDQGTEKESNTVIIEKGGGNNGNNRGGYESGETEDLGDPTKTTVYFNLTADYPEGDIVADRLMVDNVEARSGELVPNGKRMLVIEKAGYERIEEPVTIPRVRQHKIFRELAAKQRVIQFNITDAETGEKLTPEQVLVGSREIRDNGKLKPGRARSLEIHKNGYESVVDSLALEPGEGVYVLERKMTPVKKENPTIFKWNISTDYPPDEPIENPDAVLVDGKEAEAESPITPGEHTIEIRNAGYDTLTKKVEVPKNTSVYIFKATMISLPRPVQVDISYDAEPTPELGGTKVELKSLASDITKSLQTGDKVKPGAYELFVEKAGYVSYRDKKKIYPGVSPYVIKVNMESKPVVIDARITFDINPPAFLEPHVISFTARDAAAPQKVRPGGSIKPGQYSYTVEKAGYAMKGDRKDITIPPSEKPFIIQESMVALPRQISFDVVDQRTKVMVAIQEAIINNQKVKYTDNFQPGQKYHIVVKFREYATVEQDITIEPGNGPYILNVPLTRKQ